MTDQQRVPLEGQRVGYVLLIPTPKALARDIAAFANTEGGKIFFGRSTGQNMGDTPDHKALQSLITEAQSLLHPTPQVKYKQDISSPWISVLEVSTSSMPILTQDGRYYVRKGAQTTLAEENLIEALAGIVPSLMPQEMRVPSRQKSEQMVGEPKDDIANVLLEKLEETPGIRPDALLMEWIEQTRVELLKQRTARFQQARMAFTVALGSLSIATILILIGVILIFTKNLPAGVLTSLTGIVSDIVTGLVFVFYKQTNDRLDKSSGEMRTLDTSYVAMQYISTISDPRMRDQAIRDMVQKLLAGSQINQ